MQKIIIQKPYQFIPPHRGHWWPTLIQRLRLIDRWLRKTHGIVQYECRHVDRLRESLDAGHGILLTPNHCCPSDPIVMGFPAREARTHVFAMASWHLFNQDWFTRYAIRKMGAFSVNREGIDRQAINTAINILETASRPLILFPEGATTRTNDTLHDMLDGVAFIARTAAKRRARSHDGGKVVLHPVAIKYFLLSDLDEAVNESLAVIEHRLTWPEGSDMSVMDRIIRVGRGLLALKEIEYFGKPRQGSTHDRCAELIQCLLSPLEQRWLGSSRTDEGVVPRVKALRMAIVPDMVKNELGPEDHQQRWQDLGDIYLAQQISCYPPDYLTELPSVDRLHETVQRFEEDVTDTVQPRGEMKVVLEIGEAIEVDPQRDRNAETDPLMERIRSEVQAMLDRLARESALVETL